ncbi:MAG: PIN domain-containing protein [Clostridiales bacterium]|nr:PIN domain-containing protein [Clostridiales bacterium]
MKRTYLIDSENINDVWVELLQCLEEDDGILVFFTDKSAHMGYDRIIRIMEQEKGTIQWIRCFEGQNALDFQLVTEMGHQIYLDPEREYVIVSNDTGYDAAVRYWQQRGSSVSRMRGVEIERLVSDTKRRSQQQKRTGRRGASTEGKTEAERKAMAAEPKAQAESNVQVTQKTAGAEGKAAPKPKALETKAQPEPEKMTAEKKAEPKPTTPETERRKASAEPKTEPESKTPTAEEKSERKPKATERKQAESGSKKDRKALPEKQADAWLVTSEERKMDADENLAAVTAEVTKTLEDADNRKSSEKKKRRKDSKLRREKKAGTEQETEETCRSTATLEPVEQYWPGEEHGRKLDYQMGTLGTDNWDVAAQAHSSLELDLYYDPAEADSEGGEPETDATQETQCSEETEDEIDEDEPGDGAQTLGCREALLAIFEETGSRTPHRDLKFLKGLCRCVKLSDMSGLHNILEYQFGQETGNAIYHYIKKNPTCRDDLAAGYLNSKKQRERQYLELILWRNLGVKEDAEAVWKILTAIPRKNLSSIHGALVRKFGQEKGAGYYAVLRNHVKIVRGL